MEDQTTVAPIGWDAATPAKVFEEVRDRFVKGERLTKLSEEYGIKYDTLTGKSSRDGWAELREEYERQSRKAASTPLNQLANEAKLEQMIGPRTDYLIQVDQYREAGAKLQREYDRIERMLDQDELDTQERVALTQTLIRLHERLQVALAIPTVKPVELRQSGSERRVAAVPVG